MNSPAESRGHRVRRGLQFGVGWAHLHRWPWPLWKLKGSASLPIGPETFVFAEADRPELVWWAHEAHRGTWERPMVEELTGALRPGDVFFDVGAFVGPYTLLASRRVGPDGRVVAFEPDARARSLLQRNIEANGATNVTVLPVALGDHEGTVRFAASGDSVGHIASDGEVEVEMATLDGICARLGFEPTVMKVDIEGGEAAALGGSDVARRVRTLVLEVHEPELRQQGVDPDAFLGGLGPQRLLEPKGSGNYAVTVGSGT